MNGQPVAAWRPGLVATAGGPGRLVVTIAVQGEAVSRTVFFVELPDGGLRQFDVLAVAERTGCKPPMVCINAHFADAYQTRVAEVARWLHAVGLHRTDPGDLFATPADDAPRPHWLND